MQSKSSLTLPIVLHRAAQNARNGGLSAAILRWLETHARQCFEAGRLLADTPTNVRRAMEQLLGWCAPYMPAVEMAAQHHLSVQPAVRHVIACLLLGRLGTVQAVSARLETSYGNTQRCCKAGAHMLSAALRDNGYGVWPSCATRRKFLGMYGHIPPFNRVTGCIDGMLVPVIESSANYSRKSRRAYNVAVITSALGHILHFRIDPGNWNDHSATLALLEEDLHGPWLPDEMLLADKGYEYVYSEHILPKRRRRLTSRPARRVINKHIESHRCATEHVHGRLKGMFPALHGGLRVKYATTLIDACIRVYTYLVSRDPPRAPGTTWMLQQPTPRTSGGLPLTMDSLWAEAIEQYADT